MRRSFNTAGPCDPARDYMISPMGRLPEVVNLVDASKYFVVHAPRQVGKTTAFLALARALTDSGRYVAIVLSVETGSPFPEDPSAAEASILRTWRQAILNRLPAPLQPPPWGPATDLQQALAEWARASPRPLVVFIDEIDSLSGSTLLSVLRQLRSGYADRPRGFPQALALVGMCDLRDYRLAEDERVRGASPFNVVAESLTMRDFDASEIAELLAQHTAETGQSFDPAAVARLVELTRGQPWLVNAMARQLTEVFVPNADTPIRAVDVEAAKERLIQRQDTHIDSLAARLAERRVREVIEPMLAGELLGAVSEEDRRFCVDLGLVRRVEDGGLEVANPIYREVIVRTLTSGTRDSLPTIQPTWLRADGGLDSASLLDSFLAFWRQHGEPLLGTTAYHEVAPHLVLMAFLHRVVNGRGTVEREYAIGRGRMDLLLRYGPERLAIELKVLRDGRPDPIVEGLGQLDEYLAGLGLDTGWLVVFDQRAARAPADARVGASERRTPAGRLVTAILA